MTESRANITVGSAETPEMSIRRDSATGIENLGPTRARAKQTKGSLCVRKLADGGQEGPSLENAPAKQILTPLRRPKRSAEKFEIGGSNPGATRKIARGERLRGRASRDDLGLLKIDLEPNKPKATDQGRKEVPKSRSRTCAKPIIEEERTNVDATRKQGLRGSTGLSNDRLDGKSEEDRAQRVALLNSPRTGNNLRSRHTRASEEDTVVTITAVDPWNERGKMNTSSPQHRRSVNVLKALETSTEIATLFTSER